MLIRSNLKRFLGGLGIMALVVILGYLAIRPWHLRWGATDEEVARSMPGDLEHIGWTRAITINAAPEEIWPWLAQWGQGRGGWYSYDWLENLFSFDIHTADRILPGYQNLKVGDPICMSRDFCPSHVTVLESNRWLSWQAKGEDGQPVWTFTFGLFPVDEEHTRLIVRESFDNTFMPPAAVATLEIPDVVMELKALNTVKGRAEGVRPSAWAPPLEIMLWFIPLIAGLIAALFFAARTDWISLALLVVSVLILLLITFLFPPLWLRLVLDVILLTGLAWMHSQPAVSVRFQPAPATQNN